MKTRKHKTTLSSLAILTVASIIIISGCATKPPLALDPVGPAPGGMSIGTTGSLIVYSAYDPYGMTGGMGRQVHTSYEILSADGKPIQRVRNDTGSLMSGPSSIQLTAGSYRVIARANGYDDVSVPVVIQNGKETVIHLEGGGSWPNREEMIKTGAVCLPDGRVVGWRAP